jgi:hypothetical protein
VTLAGNELAARKLLTALFLGVLALAWVAVFLPAALRARQASPLSTAERFKRRMQLIAPAARRARGRWVVVPESYDRLARSSFRRGQRRRVQLLLILTTASALSALVALGSGGAAWELHLAFDASLALYVSLLLEAKKRRTERDTKVRALRSRRDAEIVFEGPAEATGGPRT